MDLDKERVDPGSYAIGAKRQTEPNGLQRQRGAREHSGGVEILQSIEKLVCRLAQFAGQ